MGSDLLRKGHLISIPFEISADGNWPVASAVSGRYLGVFGTTVSVEGNDVWFAPMGVQAIKPFLYIPKEQGPFFRGVSPPGAFSLIQGPALLRVLVSAVGVNPHPFRVAGWFNAWEDDIAS